MQDFASPDISQKRFALFPEPDQHAAFLAHVFHTQPRLVAIAPYRSGQGIEYPLRRYLADAFQVIQQGLLLGLNLGGGMLVLKAAATTDVKMCTTRLDTLLRGPEQFTQFTLIMFA